MGILQDPTPAKESIDIAVIGLGCRFPGGASDPEKFWHLLSNKQSALCRVPESRYNVDAFHHAAREKLNTLSASQGHFLEEDVAAFDAPFFNITAQEATAMDPTARMLLEVTYEAMENAGIPIERLAGSDTSCYVGCFTRDYHEMLMRDAETAPLYAGTGTGFSLLSNRISWFYDLRGPSMTLDTACSSSLVGLHLACQGLRNGESKIAVVSGANLILSPDLGMWLANLRMTSIDGLSRSFAEGVTGYGRGEGIAALILKPVKDALRDGDPIRAVIRGTGVNQDGHTTGITVPNREAQATLIQSTYKSAGLDVSETSYFEAHGTGTAVGDPLELGAVATAISADRGHDDALYVGSVKSNIGHLEGAAGLAGVIKCILMLEKGAILPNIHFDQPSKRIPFDEWRIKVPTEVTPWPSNRLQRASVNSFGYGGTNAHAILDNFKQFLGPISGMPCLPTGDYARAKYPKLFVLNAPGESALRRTFEHYGEFLNGVDDSEEGAYLERLAYTLSDRRSQFPWKAAAVASSLEELKEKLKAPTLVAHTAKQPRVAFVFTGQGAQWAQMGVELLVYPIFRESIEAADAYLRVELGSKWSVLEELSQDAATSRIDHAEFSQPLCTVLQIALVQLLASWNVIPMAVVGHSSGEIAAAFCYGALTREDAWTVAFQRGKVCSELSLDPGYVKGAMMAVGLSAEAVSEHIKKVHSGTVVIACINSPSSVTISGDTVGIDELQDRLATAGIFHRRLQVEHAYHSHHMQSAANTYLDQVSTISTKVGCDNASVQMVSSVTGMAINSEELGAAYWVRNLVSCVRFSDAVSKLLQNPTRQRRRPRPGEAAVDFLVEIGPHGALKGPLRQILQHHGISAVTYTSMLQKKENATITAAHTAGELYVSGVPVQISAVNHLNSKLMPMIDLPSYPWDHSLRYWAESRLSRNYRFRNFGRHDLLGAPVADASAKQPRWRNVLRVQEQPWLRDHIVHSSILFPASGSIVMVLEAIQQIAVHQIESMKLEQIRITKAIVIPDDQMGIEITLQLRHIEESSDALQDCWEFTIDSCRDGHTLEQNSAGRAIARYTSDKGEDAIGSTGKTLLWQAIGEEYKSAFERCNRVVEGRTFYEATHEAGLQYGPLFQGLTAIRAGSHRSVNTLKITDTKTSMPGGIQSPHLIHPSTLDVIFHSMFGAMGDEDLDFQQAAVPIGFDSIIFYMNIPSRANEQLRNYCHVKRESRDLLADIYVSDETWQQPMILVNGLRCRELPAKHLSSPSRDNTIAPVGALIWKPDLMMLDEARLKDYITSSLEVGGTTGRWENEVRTVADLAAHKDPDLRILQVGHSDVLVRSLLSTLCDKPGKTARCSSYRVLDPDQEAVGWCKKTYAQWSDVLSFDILDIEASGSSLLPMDNPSGFVIVNNRVLPWRQLEQLKEQMGPESSLILVDQGADDISRTNGHTNGHGNNNPIDTWKRQEPSPTQSWSLLRKLQHTAVCVDRTIYILEPACATSQVLNISHHLSLLISAQGLRSKTVRWSSDISELHGKSIISLLDLQSPVLPEITTDDYTILKTLMLNSARTLWVAMGSDPGMQAALGYLRVLQNENIDLDNRFLLLEEHVGRSPEDVPQTIATIAGASTTDREYIEVSGCLNINRWANDDNISHVMIDNHVANNPSIRRLGDIRTPLKLVEHATHALYDAIDDWSDTLAPNEVEVQVKAIALKPRGVSSPMGFAGIIKSTGAFCSRIKPGDLVWGYIAEGTPQTYIRVNESLCHPLISGSNFEEAATWSTALGTAYAALIDIAKLRDGQTLLVQGAASSIGQFAVQIAQRRSVVVLVTIDTDEERPEIEDLGVAAHHILREDDPDLDVAISHLTQGKGPNVILSQSSTGKALQRLWNCISASGILVDVNFKVETNSDTDLSIAPFRREATYSVFEPDRMFEQNPSLMSEVVKHISQSKEQCNLLESRTRSVWRGSEADKALQWAHANPGGGTAVLSFDDNDQLPVAHEVVNPLLLGTEATYLLVGGTGGLGTNLATFLAEKGARHLAVVSRSGPLSKTVDYFRQKMESMGVTVYIHAVDVSDKQSMRRFLDQCAAEMPPIRGVIQCAAVLNDAIYNNMTHEQWQNAIRPKIHGSWILHELLPRDLDFFVMLSSIAGVVGNRSQANYAAGNTYQDALAHYRRSQGLPAVTVDLGLMLGIGLIAERGGATNLKKWEAVGIEAQGFHRLMTAAIVGSWNGHPLPAQVICGLPTGGILQSEGLERPFYFDDPRFAYLRKKDLVVLDDQPKAESLPDRLGKVQSLREGVDLITAALTERLAVELKTDIANIDSSRPLHSYGVDSLSAVEIRNWILINLKADLSLFELLSGGSIHALATRLAAISKAIPDTAK